MSIDQLAERATIYRLILSPMTDVENVIALFKDKDAARALRSRVDMLKGKVDTFEAQKRAYQKAMMDWEHQGNIARYHEEDDFIGLLQDADTLDRDLWHVVACEIERGVKVDEDALFWALSQPSCDHATVAAFVQKYIEQGYAASRVARESKKNSSQFMRQQLWISQTGISKLVKQPFSNNAKRRGIRSAGRHGAFLRICLEHFPEIHRNRIYTIAMVWD
jgi:hypothetical protein